MKYARNYCSSTVREEIVLSCKVGGSVPWYYSCEEDWTVMRMHVHAHTQTQTDTDRKRDTHREIDTDRHTDRCYGKSVMY